MTWKPPSTIPRTGEKIIIAVENPAEDHEGVHYPRTFDHFIVRYKAVPFSSGALGPFVWRQEEGSAIAEFLPCAWKYLEGFEGW